MALQGLKDKKFQYYGSDRTFYSGIGLGSTVTWNFLGFSGTNTGFGAASQELSQRFAIASSGTSYMQWSWNSGLTVGGEVYPSDAVTLDGINQSGVWLRSNAASQLVRVWAW